MAEVTTFSETLINKLCDIFADPATGLTGSEIGTYLLRLEMPDPGAGLTKRSRLMGGLLARQAKDQSGRSVIAFVQAAMDPLRYAGMGDLFESRRDALAAVLESKGLVVKEDGKVRFRIQMRDPDQVESKSLEFMKELQRRALHQEVLPSISPIVLEQGNFHVACEIARTVADRLRTISGLTCDGSELVDRALGGLTFGRLPLVSLSTLEDDSERSEHGAFVALMKGFLGAFRQTAGHGPRIPWAVSDTDIIDLATMASFLHRRLDRARRLWRSRGVAVNDAGLQNRLGEGPQVLASEISMN
jgi:uncharacterized protein (TIGR02391 family)